MQDKKCDCGDFGVFGPTSISVTPAPASRIVPQIRWMIRRDMPQILEIEARSFQHPWREGDFIHYLRQRNCIGMIAEHNTGVVGYMLYELHRSRLHLLNFAVHPDFRRREIGTAMVRKLAGKLTTERRDRVMLEVRETNLAAQLFFKACGFRAVAVLRDFYEDSAEDAYLMQLRYGEFMEPNVPCYALLISARQPSQSG